MISPRKTQSGMKAGIVVPFSYSNIGWNNPNDPRHNVKFRFLADICCSVGEKYYIKNRHGRWEALPSKGHAAARLYQEHGGQQGANQINLDDIKAFLNVAVLHFDDTTYAPLQPDYVLFNGHRRLNLYCDTRLEGDIDHIPDTEEFLKIIRNSLCAAADELPLGDMLEELWSKNETPFRWVMHWLAARYQMPGVTTQTNLWFCGKRGTGKGSLISVLRMVFGYGSCRKIDQSDVNRGWSTSLTNADIVEWDEFKGTGWHDLNRFIKEKTGNDTFTATKRNVGDVEHPMVAAHIMATNEAHPMFVEEDDRQNCFIRTTDDPAWIARAKELWDIETNNLVNPDIPSGMAALFNSLDIDFEFIRRPLNTAMRQDLTDYFADDTLQQWFDSLLDNPLGYEYPKWEELHSNYKQFCHNHTNTKAMDLKSFRKQMRDKNLAEPAFGKKKMANGDRPSFRYVKLLHGPQLVTVDGALVEEVA